MSLLEEYLPDVIPKAFVVQKGRLDVLELHQLELVGERNAKDPSETLYEYAIDEVESYYFPIKDLILDEREAWKQMLPQLEARVNWAHKEVLRCENAYSAALAKVNDLSPRNPDGSYK